MIQKTSWSPFPSFLIYNNSRYKFSDVGQTSKLKKKSFFDIFISLPVAFKKPLLFLLKTKAIYSNLLLLIKKQPVFCFCALFDLLCQNVPHQNIAHFPNFLYIIGIIFRHLLSFNNILPSSRNT